MINILYNLNKTHKLKGKIINITDDEKNYIKIMNGEISPVYKTLKYQRLFQITIYSNCFLNEKIDKSREERLWYHWEYYAYSSPIWKKN